MSKSNVPHSWSLNAWPSDVYPHTSSRARYVTRVHRADLIQHGALVRVGRELVIVGQRYSRWLERQAVNVPGYECNAHP